MPEPVNRKTLEAAIADLHPKVIAFEAEDFHDDLIAITKQAGAAIYVDRFLEADAPSGYQDAIDRGADGIQTNRLEDLMKFLRSRALPQVNNRRVICQGVFSSKEVRLYLRNRLGTKHGCRYCCLN